MPDNVRLAFLPPGGGGGGFLQSSASTSGTVGRVFIGGCQQLHQVSLPSSRLSCPMGSSVNDALNPLACGHLYLV